MPAIGEYLFTNPSHTCYDATVETYTYCMCWLSDFIR